MTRVVKILWRQLLRINTISHFHWLRKHSFGPWYLTDPDSSHREPKFVVRLAVHGAIFTNFVGLKNIGKANADGISQALITMMTGSFGSVWKTKVVEFGTDGASVMMGSNNGTVKKTKDQIARPYILAVHCSVHHNDRINAILHNFKRPCQ